MNPEPHPRTTAEVFGSPGEGARVSGLFRVLWPFLAVVLAAGYLLGMAAPVAGVSSRMIGFGLLLAAGLLGWTVPWSEQRFKRYAKGAQGEETVARMLAFLPAGFFIFHSLPMKGRREWPGKNYDHVVVGPTGLFVVETKNWSGHITLEDDEILHDGIEPDCPPLEQVSGAAADLQQSLQEDGQLEVPVQPVLCFAGDPLAGGRRRVGAVLVSDALAVRDVLLKKTGAPLSEDACRGVVSFLKSQYD